MFIILWLALSALVGYLGRNRAIGFIGFFIASLILSPILTFLILILSTPGKAAEAEA